MVASVLVTIKNLAMRWVGARWRRKKRIVIRCAATFGILIFQSIEIYAHTHIFSSLTAKYLPYYTMRKETV